LGGADVWEVLLDGEFLMSSAVNESEIALATLALARLDREGADVLVGGLGLGHTAAAALDDDRVRSVTVVEYLPRVIDWRQRGLTPLGERLCGDCRCRTVEGDFFALLASGGLPQDRYDAILIDIDHSPRQLLNESHAAFYTVVGLRQAARHLTEGGVLAVWSADSPDEDFLAGLQAAFTDVAAEVIDFANPMLNRRDSNTIYLTRSVGA